MEIGTLLRKLRVKKGFTTRDVAGKMGIAVSTYTDWEHDKSAPSLRMYMALAHAFEVNPVDLMSYLTGHTDQATFLQDQSNEEDIEKLVRLLKINNDLLIEKNQDVLRALAQIKFLIEKQEPNNN